MDISHKSWCPVSRGGRRWLFLCQGGVVSFLPFLPLDTLDDPNFSNLANGIREILTTVLRGPSETLYNFVILVEFENGMWWWQDSGIHLEQTYFETWLVTHKKLRRYIRTSWTYRLGMRSPLDMSVLLAGTSEKENQEYGQDSRWDVRVLRKVTGLKEFWNLVRNFMWSDALPDFPNCLLSTEFKLSACVKDR